MEKAKAVLIDDPETMQIINDFALSDNRNPTNAARELIIRGYSKLESQQAEKEQSEVA